MVAGSSPARRTIKTPCKLLANLPVSTLIRLWTLDRLRVEDQDTGGTVAERLERLEKEVFKRPA